VGRWVFTKALVVGKLNLKRYKAWGAL